MLPREKLNIRNIHGPFPFHLITVVERRGFFGWITDQAQELAHKTFYSWLARYSSVNLDWLVRNAVLWSPGFDREFNIGLANPPPLPRKGQSSLLKAPYSRASVVENKINTTWFWRRYWPFSLIKTFIWWICSGKNPLHSFVVRANMLKVCNKWIIFMLSFRAVFIAEFCFSRLAHYKWPKPKKNVQILLISYISRPNLVLTSTSHSARKRYPEKEPKMRSPKSTAKLIRTTCIVLS